MYESGVVRLWDVVRFNLVVMCGVLLPRKLIKTRMCIYVCVFACVSGSVTESAGDDTQGCDDVTETQ